MTLLRSSAMIGGLTLISRVLGFVRDQLFANLVGAGMAADCFVTAFRLPNLFRALFAEGAFSAAFVPMFVKTIKDHGNDVHAGRRFAEEALAVLLPLLILFTALMMIATPTILWLMQGGKVSDPARLALASEFTRLTFPYLLFISLVSLLGGIMNGLGKFGYAAAAPILLNVTLIIGLYFFHGESDETAARTQSIAVTVSGIVQFLWIFWAAYRSGMSLRLFPPRWTERIRRLLKTAAPAALGAGASQINLFISTSLSFGVLGQGAASYLYYADRLNQLPLGLIGIGIGTALLPTLSKLIAAQDVKTAIYTQNRALELALFFALPATAGLMVIAHPLVELLLQHGAFKAADTHATAQTLMAFSLGLPAYIMIKILVPGFHARGDTRTPVRIGFISIGFNLVGNFLCVFFSSLSYAGIALSTAVSAWVNVFLLYHQLNAGNLFAIDERLKKTVLKLIMPIILMSATAWGVTHTLHSWIGSTLILRACALFILLISAFVAYMVSALALGAIDMAHMKRIIRRQS